MKINKLRSFVYLDKELVKEFLSQLEKGHYEKEKITDSSSERTIDQNANSEFERLHEILTEEGLNKSLLENDAEWQEIDAGDLLEIDMVINVNILNTLLSNPLFRSMIFSEQPSTDAKQLEQVIGNDVTATAKVAINDTYSFIMKLRADYLYKPDSLEGELTILCKIHRKLKEGEIQVAMSVPNQLKHFFSKEGQMHELKQKIESGGMSSDGLEVKSPGAILIPIAIYR